tara:strand:+ start:146 stop:568 length:423 start_codon:yes stop_codon:yes gene_type:complete
VSKIKIYSGGSTGLVQQKGIRPANKKIKSSYIFKDIKDTLKEMYKVDIVFIQGGMFFNAIEEDAEYMEKEFEWSKHDSGGTQPWNVCSCRASKKMEDFIVRKMKEKSLKYAILRQTDYTKTKVTRTVISSFPKELEGMEF